MHRGTGKSSAGTRRRNVVRNLHPVFTSKFIDAPGRIEHFLFARIKRMASGTDVQMKFLGQCGFRREFVTAAANDFDFVVLRMYIGFHDLAPW